MRCSSSSGPDKIARVRALIAASAGAVTAWSLPALAPVVPGLAGALRVPTRCARAGSVALTFDDGPHPRGTPAVLDALAAGGVRATFFLVGEQVRRRPELAKEIVAAGHAVALHGHRHRVLLRLPPGALRRDLEEGADAVAAATGIPPTLHRAPLGIYSWPALAAVRERGWSPVLWSRWGRDWTRRATGASVAARAASGVRGGDVVLLHDADHYSAPGCWRATVSALPRILDRIAAAGLLVAPIAVPGDVVQPPGR
jgi:peptidoglycan/xylan/chitin deacetylase (PgdA/CDA1 family)